MKDCDNSYPRESAEHYLLAKAGVRSLDQLAEKLSLLKAGELLSVRDINTTPIQHSRVYLRGVAQEIEPYLARTLKRTN